MLAQRAGDGLTLAGRELVCWPLARGKYPRPASGDAIPVRCRRGGRDEPGLRAEQRKRWVRVVGAIAPRSDHACMPRIHSATATSQTDGNTTSREEIFVGKPATDLGDIWTAALHPSKILKEKAGGRTQVFHGRTRGSIAGRGQGSRDRSGIKSASFSGGVHS